MKNKYLEAKRLCERYNEMHLLAFYNDLSDKEKEELLDQILNIDFELMKKVFKEKDKFLNFSKDKITPITSIDKESLTNNEKSRYKQIGNEIIKKGGFAALTMAGGQGTRLGHIGPKGTYDLGLKNPKTLFEILADDILNKNKELGVRIPWYIMTSEENNKATVEFFESKDYFGMNKEDVMIFKQSTLPMLDENGKIILEDKGKIKSGANGSGGVFESLVLTNMLADMKKRGISWIFIGAVDNVLLKMADDLFIGFAEESQKLLASKTVIKCSPDEKVGVFCKKNGRPAVIEYTEISEKMANERNENGELTYGDGHMLLNMYNIKALEIFAKEKLDLHPAHKKASYINENKTIINPEKPNAYKFEALIFDAFPALDDIALLRVKREEEFAPIKNKEGVDSAETARKLYKDYWHLI